MPSDNLSPLEQRISAVLVEMLRISEAACVVVVSSDNVHERPIPNRHEAEFHPLHPIGTAEQNREGAEAYAYAFDYRLSPTERATVAQLYPQHALLWVDREQPLIGLS